MSQTKTLKVRMTLFFILVGGVLAMVAVVTDHWALLSPHLEHHNETCEAAHFGLWRICTTRIAVRDKKDKNCERITLSGGKVPILSAFFHFLSFQDPEISCLWELRCCQPFLQGKRWEQPGVVFTVTAKVENESIRLQLQCRLLELRLLVYQTGDF